ncbi:MAG: TrmH family RNA methyltransferase [Methylococcaceae bacterium]
MSSRTPNPATRFSSGPQTRPTHEERHPFAPDSAATDKLLRVAGFPAVSALFKTAPDRVVRFFYEERMIPRIGTFCAYMAGQRRPYRMLDTAELSRVAGTVRHGGIVAVAEPRNLKDLPLDQAYGWATAHQPLFVLDGIGNTHNLGAIARTLAFFGHERLILSDHPAQAGLSDSAYRVAEGGLEYLELFRASRLPALLHKLQTAYRIMGTSVEKGLPLEHLPEDPRPPLVILGNEEQGLSPATLKSCEVVARIRGKGAVQSLNVSASVAILAYALKPVPVSRTPPSTPPKIKRHPRKRPER